MTALANLYLSNLHSILSDQIVSSSSFSFRLNKKGKRNGGSCNENLICCFVSFPHLLSLSLSLSLSQAKSAFAVTKDVKPAHLYKQMDTNERCLEPIVTHLSPPFHLLS